MSDRNRFEWGGRILEKVSDASFCRAFDCGNKDLNSYFRTDSVEYRRQLFTQSYRLYSAAFPDITMAMADFCNDALPREQVPGSARRRISNRKRCFRSYPAIKITRLGVSSGMQNMHIGSLMLDLIKHFFLTDNRTGCRFITVDAYRTAVPFYEKNGFHQTLVKDEANPDTPTVPMFFDLKSVVP